jgi:hypothetical protein
MMIFAPRHTNVSPWGWVGIGLGVAAVGTLAFAGLVMYRLMQK